jgi:hypothetical protein
MGARKGAIFFVLRGIPEGMLLRHSSGASSSNRAAGE